MKEDVYTLAEQANEVCENTNSETRFWIAEDNGELRFFICNNISLMENIDEVEIKEFCSRANGVLDKTKR